MSNPCNIYLLSLVRVWFSSLFPSLSSLSLSVFPSCTHPPPGAPSRGLGRKPLIRNIAAPSACGRDAGPASPRHGWGFPERLAQSSWLGLRATQIWSTLDIFGKSDDFGEMGGERLSAASPLLLLQRPLCQSPLCYCKLVAAGLLLLLLL